ncbi:hypothetical protein [Nocardia carnea]|uniref:hypothetical protein n=1 Tax=Nocardia carnea TaxID=37328 RepID=UPI00245549DE|nr:hypothetical protein [Nocardia carnea]
MSEVDITGLDPAAVFAALYNNAKIQGKGIHDPRGSVPLTIDNAREHLKFPGRFDYVHGRVLKIDLYPTTTTLNLSLYDRDNGVGLGQRVVENLRATGATSEII